MSKDKRTAIGIIQLTRIGDVIQTYQAAKQLKSENPVMGKGSKPRQVAINDVLKRELKGYLGLLPNDFTLDAYLIQSTYYRTGKINNKAPTTKHIRDLFNRYGKKAGLATPIKTHSARVTAINILLDQDVPLRDVANYVGHSDTNTTRGYDRKSLKKSSSISRLLDVS